MANIFNAKLITDIPVIVSRGVVVFPCSETTLEIARPFTLSAIRAAKDYNDVALVLTQKDIYTEMPDTDDIYSVGTLVKIKQHIKNKGQVKILISGMKRVKAERIAYNGSFFEADASVIEDGEGSFISSKIEAATRMLMSVIDEYTSLMPHVSDDVSKAVKSTISLGELCDFLADNLLVAPEQRQSVLSQIDSIDRSEKLCKALNHEIEILKLEIDLSSKVRSQLDKSQKEYYLREQLKVIQNELGDDYAPGEDEETVEYLKKLNAGSYPDNMKEKLTKEIYKLEKFPFSSPEYSLLKSYIDSCLELPFGKYTEDTVDLAKAQKILDDEHYGLERVKERICEFIAAKKYNPEYKGQILCLVGPPGVGKTSVASSVAKALGRTMVRISLGGIHDEADIRGHRKTYIGAMPGRIITAINQAKVMNPLILFDEIDKLGGDGYHGDPSSALLEVLDVEQNKAFRDHFIEFDVNLSDCMFICTANTSSTIPKPLLDRMEIVELCSYTMNEKIHIAKKHLLPRQLGVHGLKKKQVTISDKAIIKLIEQYTKEAGVRNLERELAKLLRKSVKRMLECGTSSVSINENNLSDYVGMPKYIPEKTAENDEVGLVNGLAWTEVGGELLKVEAAVMPGTGKLELTGSLGDVMKESAHAAVSYIRTRADELTIDSEFYKNKDIHLHFPDGATPKDGPSAGIAITTCLISALTGRSVKHDIAMTGEVTIRGKVLPIGGLKEKTMAAASHKMKTVLIPADNITDLADIDKEVKSVLNFIPVTTMDEVIKEVFAESVPAKKKQSVRNKVASVNKSSYSARVK